VGGDALGLAFAPPAEAAAAQAKALAATSDLVIFVTHLGPADIEILKAVPTCPLVVGATATRGSRSPSTRGAMTGWVVQADGVHRRRKVTLDVHRDEGRPPQDERAIPLIRRKSAATPRRRRSRGPPRRDRGAEGAEVGGRHLTVTCHAARTRATRAPRARHGRRDRARPRGDVGSRTAADPRGAAGGPVTRRTVPPDALDNTVVTQTLTGAGLREIVGFSLKTGLSGRISPLEVSGLTARFRIVERDGKQAVEWLAFDVGGKPLDDAKAYRVALNSFLAGGGDGYKQLVKPDAKDSGVLVRDVLGDALGKAGTYAPDRASRLVEEK
jgi:hypothetical protein